MQASNLKSYVEEMGGHINYSLLRNSAVYCCKRGQQKKIFSHICNCFPKNQYLFNYSQFHAIYSCCRLYANTLIIKIKEKVNKSHQ